MNDYTFKVMLKNEYIGHVGNIRRETEQEALKEAMSYVEDSWQGYRVHPTELKSLTFKLSSINGTII